MDSGEGRTGFQPGEDALSVEGDLHRRIRTGRDELQRHESLAGRSRRHRQRRGRSSCGIGVVGGLLFAMFLTLYFIPAAFYVSHKNK